MTAPIDILAWTLLHFVWQGAGLAAVVALGLQALHDAPAAARYRLACGGLVAMALAPVVTAVWLAGAGGPAASVLSMVAEPTALPAGPTWTTGLVIAWALGVLAGLGRQGLQLARLELLRRRSIAAPPTLALRFRVLARRLRLPRRVRLRLVPTGDTPLAMGLLRPVVLLPASLLVQLPPAQVEALLVHELAHVRRHDWAVNLAQALLEALLFYHPAVHWLSRTVRHEREACCDALATATLSDPIGYARALTALQELRLPDCPDPTTQLAPAARGGVLMDRIARIIGRPQPHRRPAWVLPALALSLIAGLTTAAVAVASPQAPPRAEIDEADDVTAVEDVGARALEVLSDGLQRGADSLDAEADKLEARADERQRRRRERRAHRGLDGADSELAELERELDRLRAEVARERRELARLRGDVTGAETVPRVRVEIHDDPWPTFHWDGEAWDEAWADAWAESRRESARVSEQRAREAAERAREHAARARERADRTREAALREAERVAVQAARMAEAYERAAHRGTRAEAPPVPPVPPPAGMPAVPPAPAPPAPAADAPAAPLAPAPPAPPARLHPSR